MDINTFDYYQFFYDIVDNLRLEGDVSNIVDNNNNTYTFETQKPDNLQVGRWLSFLTFDAQIKNITGNVIICEAPKGKDLTGINEFKRLDPYFNADIQQRTALSLTLSDMSQNGQSQKFPLIELVLNDIKMTDSYFPYNQFDNIEFIMSVETDYNYSGKERIEQSFKSVLYPLYENFKKAILSSFEVHKPSNIEFDRQDVYLASYRNANKKNSKNTFVDAVKINIKNLIFRNTTKCK